MKRRIAAILVLAGLSAPFARAEPVLYGVRVNGDVVWIDRASGAAALAVGSGVQNSASLATIIIDGFQSQAAHDAAVIAGGGAQLDELVTVDLRTGGVAETVTITGRPPGYSIRGLARAISVYVLLAPDSPGSPELLATMDASAHLSVVGSTGRTDLDTLASNGVALYTIGLQGDGQLFSVNTATAATTLIGGGGYGGDTHALAVFPDGTAVACGANLRSVNLATGAATLIGPLGASGIQALIVGENRCYANCVSGGVTLLNVEDFTCFLYLFSSGLPYANCDHSVTSPVLNIADFTCFLRKYSGAEGCQ